MCPKLLQMSAGMNTSTTDSSRVSPMICPNSQPMSKCHASKSSPKTLPRNDISSHPSKIIKKTWLTHSPHKLLPILLESILSNPSRIVAEIVQCLSRRTGLIELLLNSCQSQTSRGYLQSKHPKVKPESNFPLLINLWHLEKLKMNRLTNQHIRKRKRPSSARIGRKETASSVMPVPLPME